MDGHGLVDRAPLDELREAFGDLADEELPDLVRTWEAQAEDLVGRMRAAVLTGDGAGLRAAAHMLKGSSGALGAFEVADVCGRLEHSDTPPAGLASVVERCAATVRDTAAALWQVVRPGSA